jgi:hypothetical protein
VKSELHPLLAMRELIVGHEYIPLWYPGHVVYCVEVRGTAFKMDWDTGNKRWYGYGSLHSFAHAKDCLSCKK